MDTKQQELIKSAYDALMAIVKQWKVAMPETPFGRIWYVSGSITSIGIQTRDHRSFTLSHDNESYHFEGDSSFENATEKIAAVAQWYVSQDFLKKVEGSMARMKAIARALAE